MRNSHRIRTQTIRCIGRCRWSTLQSSVRRATAGIEAVRWVLGHPRLSLALATSAADAGRPIVEVYPALRGHDGDAVRGALEWRPSALARPSRFSQCRIPLRWRSCRDCSMRASPSSTCRPTSGLSDAALYERWYGEPHTSASLLVRGRVRSARARPEQASPAPVSLRVPAAIPRRRSSRPSPRSKRVLRILRGSWSMRSRVSRAPGAALSQGPTSWL